MMNQIELNDSSMSITQSPPSYVLQEILGESRCALCGYYLSVTPISIISEDGHLQKCGRCADIKTQINQRNAAFENLTRHFSFPCSFETCGEILDGDNVEAHEQACPQRRIDCPLNSICNKSPTVEELREHFEASHRNNIRYGNVYHELKFGQKTCFMLYKDELPFLIRWNSGEKNEEIHVSAFCFSSDLNYKFTITLRQKFSFDVSLTYEGKVICFDEREHCSLCLRKKCGKRHHKYSEHYPDDCPTPSSTIRINYRAAQRSLKTNDFHCSIIVHEGNGLSNRRISDDFFTRNNEKLICKILQCPVCKGHMWGRIFACKAGHKICSICVQGVSKCSLCDNTFDNNGRHFDLEEISDKVEIPCKYRTCGCNYSGNIRMVLEHQEFACGFRT